MFTVMGATMASDMETHRFESGKDAVRLRRRRPAHRLVQQDFLERRNIPT
jgi:hypothetical protein